MGRTGQLSRYAHLWIQKSMQGQSKSEKKNIESTSDAQSMNKLTKQILGGIGIIRGIHFL